MHYYKRGLPMIIEISARIIRTIIIHFTIAHAILPITAKIKKIIAIMINSVKSQSILLPIGNLFNIAIDIGKLKVITPGKSMGTFLPFSSMKKVIS
jgi:hypothetical protein